MLNYIRLLAIASIFASLSCTIQGRKTRCQRAKERGDKRGLTVTCDKLGDFTPTQTFDGLRYCVRNIKTGKKIRYTRHSPDLDHENPRYMCIVAHRGKVEPHRVEFSSIDLVIDQDTCNDAYRFGELDALSPRGECDDEYSDYGDRRKKREVQHLDSEMNNSHYFSRVKRGSAASGDSSGAGHCWDTSQEKVLRWYLSDERFPSTRMQRRTIRINYSELLTSFQRAFCVWASIVPSDKLRFLQVDHLDEDMMPNQDAQIKIRFGTTEEMGRSTTGKEYGPPGLYAVGSPERKLAGSFLLTKRQDLSMSTTYAEMTTMQWILHKIGHILGFVDSTPKGWPKNIMLNRISPSSVDINCTTNMVMPHSSDKKVMAECYDKSNCRGDGDGEVCVTECDKDELAQCDKDNNKLYQCLQIRQNSVTMVYDFWCVTDKVTGQRDESTSTRSSNLEDQPDCSHIC